MKGGDIKERKIRNITFLPILNRAKTLANKFSITWNDREYKNGKKGIARVYWIHRISYNMIFNITIF